MSVVWPQDGTPNGDKVHRADKPVLPGALSEEAILVEKLQKELRTVAALEVLFPHSSMHACWGHKLACATHPYVHSDLQSCLNALDHPLRRIRISYYWAGLT